MSDELSRHSLLGIKGRVSLTQKETVAVIPAFNEEVSIGSVVLKTLRHVDKVIVVDDGSLDNTAAVARLAGAEVIRLKSNHGKAFALKRGLEAASSNGFDVAVTLDADGQHDPCEIPIVIDPVINGEAELVIGSRFINGVNQVPRYRRFGQRVLNAVSNAGNREDGEPNLTDSQSGFRALGRTALMNMDFESRHYNIEQDMILNFRERGLRIKEVPISVSYDVPNKHKRNPLSHGISVLGRGITIVSQKRPLLLLGVPGFVLFLIGLVLGVASFLNLVLMSWTWLFQTLIAVFTFTIGLVLCITALVLNSIADLLNRVRLGGGRGD